MGNTFYSYSFVINSSISNNLLSNYLINSILILSAVAHRFIIYLELTTDFKVYYYVDENTCFGTLKFNCNDNSLIHICTVQLTYVLFSKYDYAYG